MGKSVLFNHLTGMNVSCANYAGTTVEFAAGRAVIGDTESFIIDVPGTYTLEATNEAEEVAVAMLSGESSAIPDKDKDRGRGHCSPGCPLHQSDGRLQPPAAVLCVLDASHLESSLYLLYQVMQYGFPVVAALNRSDLAREKGELINAGLLERELGIPVVPTTAVTGEGLKKLKDLLAVTIREGETQKLLPAGSGRSAGDLWLEAEKLAAKVLDRDLHNSAESISYRRRSRWGIMLLQPWPGIPMAVLILATVFAVVVGLGMGLRQAVLLPLFRGLIIPQVVLLVQQVVPPGLLQNILVGEYGFLVKGLEWPFALVMPYVISFYFALSLLEDSGYMPRLGGLLDGLLNRIGLRGSNVIPLLLGYGCGIPAIMATRALGSRKERLMVSFMVCLAVPCISQSGAFIVLLSEKSVAVVAGLFLLSIAVLAVAGVLMDRLLKGTPQQMIMEIPELLTPRADVVAKKVWMRLKLYVTDGALPMVGAVALAAFLYESGAMLYLGKILSPLVTGWLHLPPEAAVPLVLGILRRELAVLPLVEMDLTALQLFVGAAVGLFYVPCIAIVATMAREFRLPTALLVLLVTSTVAFLVGGILSRLGAFIL